MKYKNKYIQIACDGGAATGKSTVVSTTPQTNQGYASKGRQAIQQKRWNEAVSFYQKAYKENPLSQYKEMWGYSLYRAGKSAMAKPILKQALKEGSLGANKWLGFIIREDGDVAGSNQYFAAYLASNPSDAEQIKQEMSK